MLVTIKVCITRRYRDVFELSHCDLFTCHFSNFLATFKEICPGGMGYTVLPNPPVNKQPIVHQEPTDLHPPQLLPTPEQPVEAFGTPEIIPGEPQTCNTQRMCSMVN